MRLLTLAPSGCAPDVGWWEGSWFVAWGTLDGRLILQALARHGTLVGEARVIATGPNTRLAFPRLCGPWLAYRDDAAVAHLYNLKTDTDETLVSVVGNEPVCLSADRLAWQMSGWTVCVRDIAGQTVQHTRTGAPTGLSHFDAQGYVVLVDECRFGHRAADGCLYFTGTPGDVAATRPCFAGKYRSHVEAYDGDSGLIVSCEGDDAGGMGALVQDQWAREVRLWPGEACNTPRCVLNDAGELAVVTWGDTGVRLALLDPGDDLTPYEAPPGVPLEPVIISGLTVTPMRGDAPLSTVATVRLAHAQTWRWLLNGIIDPPHDGATHAFHLSQPGTYQMAVRAQGEDGVVVTSPSVSVIVDTPAPIIVPPPAPSYPTGWLGVQTGFGEVRGAGLYAELRARGWELARIEAAHNSDPTMTALCVQEVLDAGLRPLTICRTLPDLTSVPEWTDVEWQNEPDLGTWPTRRYSPAQYVATLPDVIALCARRHLRLWVGSLSNLSADALLWLELILPDTHPSAGISVHRYPRSNLQFGAAQPGFKSRWEEVACLKQLIAPHPFLVSECGYHQSGYRSCFRKVPPLTNQEIADRMRQEIAFWREAGAAGLVWYQVGEDGDPKYGLQTREGTWKEPQSRVGRDG
ncbi:MAG: hypothetical protein PHR30_16555 [Gallionellaceae bacterium]|nr:hypothetical protein [Gallionellaceae bacterium]